MKNLSHSKFLSLWLRDKKNALHYLNELLKNDGENDFELLLHKGVGSLIKAHQVAAVSQAAQISRTSLYRSFSGRCDPRMSTFLKTIHALGLSLQCKKRKKKEIATKADISRAVKKVARKQAGVLKLLEKQ